MESIPLAKRVVFSVCLSVCLSVWALGISNAQGIQYFHSDHLGSTNLTTNQSANVTESITYTPFAETVAVIASPAKGGAKQSPNYLFTGQELDPESNLYYYNARHYDPVSSRFMSVDPVFDGLNAYAYVENNPVLFNDPTGNTTEMNQTVADVYDFVEFTTKVDCDDLCKKVEAAQTRDQYHEVEGIVLEAVAGLNEVADFILTANDIRENGPGWNLLGFAPFVSIGIVKGVRKIAVDIGAYDGAFMKNFLDRHSDYVGFSIELNPWYAKNARELGYLSDRHMMIVGDGAHLPFDKESIDLITINYPNRAYRRAPTGETKHGEELLEGFVREARITLKNHGRLIVTGTSSELAQRIASKFGFRLEQELPPWILPEGVPPSGLWEYAAQSKRFYRSNAVVFGIE